MKQVLVWLSGGVDSAVSAYILKKQGYDVSAGFMINYRAPKWEVCNTQQDYTIAKNVANFLQIPFCVFDYTKNYQDKVLKYMYEEYQRWLTPNPDIMCNSEIKFKVFLEDALSQGFDKVAMWHYAQIEEENGIFFLKKWVDTNKDQSYFLAWLNQKQISKALFPIGHLEKTQVRQIAKEIWLPNADRKDSQWICFVWKVDMHKFLEKKIKPKKWLIKDTQWNIIWEHNWVFYYTIWQRKWLHLWGKQESHFIVKKNIEENEIIVWTEDDLELFDNKLYLKNIHFPSWKIDFPFKANSKIRYRQVDKKCLVLQENWRIKVEFQDKLRAITSGQSCVLYDEHDRLIASWTID